MNAKTNKPITAWAVETDGSILPGNVFSTRDSARYIRNIEASQGYVSKASVRKVTIQVIPGR